MLEVLPLTHIRGRSLHDAFVIVDEAQSLERGVLLTVLSRIGQGSRVVLTHDVAQRDNLRVGRHDGVTAVIEALKGHPLFAHVTLTRSERSPIAAMVTDLLEDIPRLMSTRVWAAFVRIHFVAQVTIWRRGFPSASLCAMVSNERPRTGRSSVIVRPTAAEPATPVRRLRPARSGRSRRGPRPVRVGVAPRPCPRRRDHFVSRLWSRFGARTAAVALLSVGVAGGFYLGEDRETQQQGLTAQVGLQVDQAEYDVPARAAGRPPAWTRAKQRAAEYQAKLRAAAAAKEAAERASRPRPRRRPARRNGPRRRPQDGGQSSRTTARSRPPARSTAATGRSAAR